MTMPQGVTTSSLTKELTPFCGKFLAFSRSSAQTFFAFLAVELGGVLHFGEVALEV